MASFTLVNLVILHPKLFNLIKLTMVMAYTFGCSYIGNFIMVAISLFSIILLNYFFYNSDNTCIHRKHSKHINILVVLYKKKLLLILRINLCHDIVLLHSNCTPKIHSHSNQFLHHKKDNLDTLLESYMIFH